jgi:sortase A
MRTSVSFLIVAVLAFFPLIIESQTTQTPQVPDAGTKVAQASAANAAIVTIPVEDNDYPVRLVIPTLKINSPIQKMGVDETGALSVPDGSSNHVGWYEDGTMPGEHGSAVLDAHVFAAFKNLRYLKVGQSVYIKMASGKTLRFVIEDSRVYKLADVPAQTLYNRADKPRLNLITCAGKLTADRTTYDHRLIDYAVLAES